MSITAEKCPPQTVQGETGTRSLHRKVTTMKYDLRADVKSVLDSTSLSDPGEVADTVAESVPAKSLRAALRVTLRSYVRQVMAEARTEYGFSTDPGSGQQLYDTHGATAAAGKSSKRDGIREAWKRHLNARMCGSGEVWKLQREMTAVDFDAAARRREVEARQNEAWAVRLRERGAAVRDHKVATFGDLPADVQATLLGGVA